MTLNRRLSDDTLFTLTLAGILFQLVAYWTPVNSFTQFVLLGSANVLSWYALYRMYKAGWFGPSPMRELRRLFRRQG